MNFIGDKLRKLRIERRLSQQEVADKLNIDRKTYANWEQNIVDVKGSLIPNLAEIFGI
ncbi:MAG: helix-turn-helix domain-containing protein [Dysgonamonadaceae bacterium]|jgi:transcriptional regulator with XRE-family HTH domain|nr:helix-turn-helix domain-containing protein [Dysgonamonadaceae bacterium]